VDGLDVQIHENESAEYSRLQHAGDEALAGINLSSAPHGTGWIFAQKD